MKKKHILRFLDVSRTKQRYSVNFHLSMASQFRSQKMPYQSTTQNQQTDAVTLAITEKLARREKIEMFLTELEQQDGTVTEFRERLWYSLVDYVTVFSKEDIHFTFKNGMEIKVQVETLGVGYEQAIMGVEERICFMENRIEFNAAKYPKVMSLVIGKSINADKVDTDMNSMEPELAIYLPRGCPYGTATFKQ